MSCACKFFQFKHILLPLYQVQKAGLSYKFFPTLVTACPVNCKHFNNTNHSNMVLDETKFKDGPQKYCKNIKNDVDQEEKWPFLYKIFALLFLYSTVAFLTWISLWIPARVL